VTHYFDEAAGEVTSNAWRDDVGFLAELERVEARVCKDVSLCTGDREFPDSLREKIMGIIAVWQSREDGGVPTQGRQMAVVTRSSAMIGKLHGVFHQLAAGRVKTRFGMLSDDPTGNVKRRDYHDAEASSDETLEGPQ